MIVVAAVLVVCDQKERVIPAWRIAHSVVNIPYQLFAQRDIIVRMLAVASRAKIRLKERVAGQSAGGGTRLEISKMPKMTFVRNFGVRVV